jgi:hypothetical protein
MRRSAVLVAGGVLAIAACMLVPQGSAPGVVHAFVVIGLLFILALVAAICREGFRHQRLASSLARIAYPASLCGRSVNLVPGLGAAIVAGLHRPQIFCAEDLPRRLEEDELRAVILHEHHHQLVHAPARMVLIGALAPVLGLVESGRAWMERAQARLEIAADAHALASGAPRQALASALVKLASSPGLSVAPGFATASELRLRALLGESTGTDDNNPLAGRLAATLIVVVSCLAFYFG